MSQIFQLVKNFWVKFRVKTVKAVKQSITGKICRIYVKFWVLALNTWVRSGFGSVFLQVSFSNISGRNIQYTGHVSHCHILWQGRFWHQRLFRLLCKGKLGRTQAAVPSDELGDCKSRHWQPFPPLQAARSYVFMWSHFLAWGRPSNGMKLKFKQMPTYILIYREHLGWYMTKKILRAVLDGWMDGWMGGWIGS